MSNRVSTGINTSHAVRIVCEIVLGAAGAYVVYRAVALLVNSRHVLMPSNAIFPIIILVSSLVVYFIGRFGGRHGSFSSALLGNVLISIIYAFAIQFVSLLGLNIS